MAFFFWPANLEKVWRPRLKSYERLLQVARMYVIYGEEYPVHASGNFSKLRLRNSPHDVVLALPEPSSAMRFPISVSEAA